MSQQVGPSPRAAALSLAELEAALGESADEIDEIDHARNKAEEWRLDLLRAARAHGITYRNMAPWARMTNARAHQIVSAGDKVKTTS